MWGRASYFAKNASYSHRYSYRLPGGLCQMFYARVTVGKNHRIVIYSKNKNEETREQEGHPL